MRALYLKDLASTEVKIEADSFHHLVNVVRVRAGESILLLNGKGARKLAVVSEIKKKYLTLNCSSDLRVEQDKRSIDLVVAQVKKEALQQVLKMAVELQVKSVVIISTQYSQKYNLSLEKLHKIMINALEQANGSFLPKISLSSLDKELALDHKHHRTVLSLDRGQGELQATTRLFVGPEGGFSEAEQKKILCGDASSLRIPSAILRTPTAVAAGLGIILNIVE